MVRWMDDGLRTIPREGKEHMDQSANSFIHSPPSQSYAQKLSVCLMSGNTSLFKDIIINDDLTILL